MVVDYSDVSLCLLVVCTRHHPETIVLLVDYSDMVLVDYSDVSLCLLVHSIIRRLVVLVATEATLMAESQAARRQAESATAAAQKMLDDKDNSKNAVRVPSCFIYSESYL